MTSFRSLNKTFAPEPLIPFKTSCSKLDIHWPVTCLIDYNSGTELA